MKPELREGERLDDLQNGFVLIQKKGTFCLGTDSVLLADFAAPRNREKAADLGCGNGALSLLLAARQSTADVDSVELQPQMADMARRTMEYNAVSERIRVHTGDLRDAWRMLGRGEKSLVVCNPPYGMNGGALLSIREEERIARHEGDLTLNELADAASKLLKYGGRFCTVYPAQRAFEMMLALHKAGLEPKRIRTVQSTVQKPPRIVLIEAIKGGGNMLHWLPPLIMYNADGTPGEENKRIYGIE